MMEQLNLFNCLFNTSDPQIGMHMQFVYIFFLLMRVRVLYVVKFDLSPMKTIAAKNSNYLQISDIQLQS